MNIYSEVVVHRKFARDPAKTKNSIRGACWILTIVGLVFNFYLLIPAAILWIVYFFAKRILEVDYEYIQTDDILDIDMVIGSSRRANVMTFPLSQVIVVAPWDSEVLEEYDYIKPTDYSARDLRDRPYVMICVVKDQKRRLYLQLNDKMLHTLKQVIPQKVITKE